MFKRGDKVPTPRSEGLLVEYAGDETVVYDVESKEAHCLNPLASVVFANSDGQRTVAEMADFAEQRLGHAVSEAQVVAAVEELEATSLLDTPLRVVACDREGMSRRQMMRKTAFAGAAATVAGGAVMTIAVPTALAGCSKQVAGCGCSKMEGGNVVQVNTLCLSGHCCGPSTTAKCNVGCCATTNDGAICQCSNGVCLSVPTPVAGSCCNTIPCVPAVSGSAC